MMHTGTLSLMVSLIYSFDYFVISIPKVNKLITNYVWDLNKVISISIILVNADRV